MKHLRILGALVAVIFAGVSLTLAATLPTASDRVHKGLGGEIDYLGFIADYTQMAANGSGVATLPAASDRVHKGLGGVTDYLGFIADYTQDLAASGAAVNNDWKTNVRVATAGASITLETALNDADTLDGVTLATGDRVLVKNQTQTSQVETATAAGTVTGSGNATVTITSIYLDGSPLVVPVAVVNTDTASIVGGKIRDALNLVTAVTDIFTVGGSTTSISLTKFTPATNDGTLNIAIATGTATGITAAATSTNTTPGSTTADNGIWIVGATPTRATDADVWAELPGSTVVVTAGDLNAGTGWRNSSAATGTIGTTAITYDGFGSSAGVVQLVSDTGIYRTFAPNTDTDTARGTALLAAVAAAGTGQTVYVTDGTFALGSSRIALGSGVHLHMSPGTVITSLADMATDGAIVYPGDNSIIEGGTIRGIAVAGVGGHGGYQAPIGIVEDVADTARTGVIVRGVTMEGDTDGFYIQHDTACSATLYDCVIRTKWDAIMVSASTTLGPHVVEIFAPHITITGPSALPGIARGITTTYQGTVRVYGGSVTAADGGTTYTAALATLSGGTLTANGVRLSVSSSDPKYDVNNVAGTLSLAGCTGSGTGGALVTNGTITYLAAQVGALTATGKIASTATTPATLGAAATTFAITSNVATVTGDGGGNTVATITGGVSGMVLTLIFTDSNITITDTAAATADTVNLSAAFTSSGNDTITLVHNGTKWFETARSVN